jgi:hypothetical protein
MSKHNIMIMGPAPTALHRKEHEDIFEYSTPTRAFDAYMEYVNRFDDAYTYVSMSIKSGTFQVVIDKEYYVEAAKA